MGHKEKNIPKAEHPGVEILECIISTCFVYAMHVFATVGIMCVVFAWVGRLAYGKCTPRAQFVHAFVSRKPIPSKIAIFTFLCHGLVALISPGWLCGCVCQKPGKKEARATETVGCSSETGSSFTTPHRTISISSAGILAARRISLFYRLWLSRRVGVHFCFCITNLPTHCPLLTATASHPPATK